MTNQIVPTQARRALTFVDINPAALVERLGNLITNGKKLLPEERIALAQYSVATGLNPFVGECYYLPNIGPGPGIAGWRVKAEEQLEYEAMKAQMPAARFWCEYVKPGEGEGHYDPDKDIAVKAILHDTISRTTWEQRILAHYIELMKNKVENGWNIARELVGPEPTWNAIGVVRSGENFGSAEKMDRYERACKRAEKAAIRKRFPRIYLPEPLGFDPQDVIDVELHDIPKGEKGDPMQELGFGTSSTPMGNLDATLFNQNQPEQPMPEKSNGEPTPEAIYQAIVDAGLSENIHAAKNALSGWCKTGFDTVEKATAWMTFYRAKKAADASTKEAADYANEMTKK